MDVSLVDVRNWMIRYVMSSYLGFGLLGNIINILIFTRKDFLRNSCCLYLFATSILNLFILSWGIIPSIYTLENTDPSTYSYVYCKLRLYTIHTILMIGRTLIVLACIDRYALCSQSPRFRFFTQVKMAKRFITTTFLIWPFITIHIPILENFSGNKCSMVGAYILIYGIYSTMASGVSPPVLMSIFSILTIRHRHELQTRLNVRRRGSKRDRQLVVMLLSEVLVYITTTTLYPAITLYLAITNQWVKSNQQNQLESFVSFLGSTFLIYLNPASAFFVYLIASKGYRQEFVELLKYRYKQITGRITQVEPMPTSHVPGLHPIQHTATLF